MSLDDISADAGDLEDVAEAVMIAAMATVNEPSASESAREYAAKLVNLTYDELLNRLSRATKDDSLAQDVGEKMNSPRTENAEGGSPTTTLSARYATFWARSDIDAAIAYVRDEVMPVVMVMDGCVGVELLVDKQSGRCIATSAWETKESMRASEDREQPVRDRAREMLGDVTVTVTEWDIALVHRAHRSRGVCVRATWYSVPFTTEELQKVIDFYKQTALPFLDDLEGFCVVSILFDRPSGRLLELVTFDSVDAMERASSQAAMLRDKMRSSVERFSVIEEGEFELARVDGVFLSL